jgi:hypothetical protein
MRFPCVDEKKGFVERGAMRWYKSCRVMVRTLFMLVDGVLLGGGLRGWEGNSGLRCIVRAFEESGELLWRCRLR